MKRLLYIGLALLLAASCGPRIIKRAKMERILADMLVQDQQIKLDFDLKKQADSCLVYEGIFEQYGYTTEDFRRSLAYYLKDASRMEKMMGEVAEDLEARAKEAKKQAFQEEWRENFIRAYSAPLDTAVYPRPPMRMIDSLRLRYLGDSTYFNASKILR
ncbi:MAG: DUF4296 domain-containing protein [Bacteroidales bacterium]|nr:DUF4296 domain-containing protein [Bacteroidales bacterium]